MPWWSLRKNEAAPEEAGDTQLAGLVRRYLGAGLVSQAADVLIGAGRAREALSLYVERADAPGALQAASVLLQAAPQERLEMGRDFLRRGWHAQAESVLRPLAADADAELRCSARITLAEALLGLGREEEARAELELALAWDISQPDGWRLLAGTRPGREETDSALPMPGDRFSLRRLLGRGGSGKVYLASDRERPGLVALKIFDEHPAAGSLESHLEGIARVAALPPHPHLLPILDVDPALRVAVSPYLPGGSLAPLVPQRPAFERWKALLDQAAAGLQHLHSYGVLHLDVKPANLLLTERGTVVLADFSLARSAPPWPGLGSVDYAAPEALIGEPLSFATDVYSLGVVAYELACGSRPFPTGTPVRTEGYRPVAELRPDLPAAAAALIDGMLRLEPALRIGLADLRRGLRSGPKAGL